MMGVFRVHISMRGECTSWEIEVRRVCVAISRGGRYLYHLIYVCAIRKERLEKEKETIPSRYAPRLPNTKVGRRNAFKGKEHNE